MTEPLVLYTHPMSRGRIARWMLEETCAPYDTKVIDYGAAMKAPEYLAINPMGKVPALVHGNSVVTECAAICAYLAYVFPEAGLKPATDDPRIGDYYRWLFFGAGPLEAAVTNKAMGFQVPAEREAMVGYGTLERVLDVIEQTLAKQPYMAGDSFSAADVYVGSQIGWGMLFGTIEKRPTFERYYSTISERDAAKRAAALDDALMSAHPVPGRGQGA